MMLHNNSSYADSFDKARLAKHAAATAALPLLNGNGVAASAREHSPPPKLERITEGSIPISLIVDRVVRKSYAEFLQLAETLPGLSNTPRKKKMLDYLLETRRQMIKLLVLVKWARVSKEVDQCIDVVNFLHGQKNCFNNIVIQLQFVRHQLAGARLRNPDLRTAIDVLSTGDYPTFPNQLTNQFIPAAPITPKRALATLKSLNTLLHLRLTLHEVIPLPLSNYTIADGKVTFTVRNEWQLTITISEEFGRWWFVDFRDSNGESVGEVMKQRVQLVLEEPFEQFKVEYGLFPMGVTEESLRALKKKAPLVEAYNILHRFYLIHSLSKLYISLHRLAVTPRFSPYLQTASSPNRDTVEFQYWIRGPPPARNQAPRSHPVRLAIVNEEADVAFEEAVCSVPGGRTALDYERTTIGIRWIRDGVDVPDSELAAIDLTNAEKLVEQVTKIHARKILERIAAETEGLTAWTGPEKEELYFALIDSSRRIRISVDLLTGRILLTEMSNTSGMLLPQILQNAQINLTTAILPIQPTGPTQRRPYSIRECISLARLTLLKSHISTLAEYKGWTTQRYAGGYIHKPDLDIFLPQAWSWEDLLFLSLGIETVVLHVVTRQGWLLDLRNLGDGVGLRVAWTEKMPDIEYTDDRANWLDWLDTVRFFVRGRYAIYQFEKALEGRGIEYSVMPPPSQTTLSLPLLSLKVTTLIPEQSSCWAYDNLILRILPGVENIVAVWQGKVRHSTDVEQLLSSLQQTDPLSYSADKKTFSLRFPLSEESTPDLIVASLIKRFVSVERILQLVRQTKAVQQRCKDDNVFQLENFMLAGVECLYGVDGPEGELLPVQILVGGSQFDIVFRRDDPHERFKAFIPGWYNAGGPDIAILAEYLHATLPLYRELSLLETTEPPQPNLEKLYQISILPKSTTSVRVYSPQGPYMVDMTLRFFTTEEYAKWMTNLQTEKFNHDKHTVWHITDVALNGEQVDLGDGVCVQLPGMQDVWNRCGSLMGPKSHWVVPLGRGLLCDAQEGGRALKGIWGCVVDALVNPNVGDESADADAGPTTS